MNDGKQNMNISASKLRTLNKRKTRLAIVIASVVFVEVDGNVATSCLTECRRATRSLDCSCHPTGLIHVYLNSPTRVFLSKKCPNQIVQNVGRSRTSELPALESSHAVRDATDKAAPTSPDESCQNRSTFDKKFRTSQTRHKRYCQRQRSERESLEQEVKKLALKLKQERASQSTCSGWRKAAKRREHLFIKQRF
ncbi:hypothetical protein JG687_00014764 [Phytophthora cactorum]|uniref:Uncharacterized protein n=1 Tax=Phytophthora cactorum TaxID=29920 RepID=A0A8T1TW62_9STRA|nr:hypothetical protein JG687_00014764 [Phytophthora cactorum]